MAPLQSVVHKLGLFTDRINIQLYVLWLTSHITLVVIQTVYNASNLLLYGCR